MQKLVWMFTVCLCCTIATTGRAQSPQLLNKVFSTPKDSLPYRLNKNLPVFSFLLLDSATEFSTKSIPAGRIVALMLFSPDCEHCMKTFEMMLANMDSLKEIDFYIVSPAHNIKDIRNFAEKYKLSQYKNIKAVGQDHDFFFITHYGTKFVPDIALYDKRKRFIKLLESTISMKDLQDVIY